MHAQNKFTKTRKFMALLLIIFSLISSAFSAGNSSVTYLQETVIETTLPGLINESSGTATRTFMNDLSQRYVIFLNGIRTSASETSNINLNQEFGDIKNNLVNLGLSESRFVYFSYSAASHRQVGDLYCSGWGSNGCSTTTLGDLASLDLSPVYSIEDTKLPIQEQAEALNWLIGQIVKHDATAQIDLVGYSLGGILSSYWASQYGGISVYRANIHSLILIESPVGGLPFARECLLGGIPPSAICVMLNASDFIGDNLLRELQLPASSPGSIVSLLPQAARNFPLTSIQSSADYFVNSVSLVMFGPVDGCVFQCVVTIGQGTQYWVNARHTLHMEMDLGGLGIATAPVPQTQVLNLLQRNHGDPLHNEFTALWVAEAIQAVRPSSEFDTWPTSGNARLTTEFHIVDTANITSCFWNYGDGQRGTTCAPFHFHTYANPGSYHVTLTVNGPGGSDSLTRHNYIVVNQPPTSPSSTTQVKIGGNTVGNFNIPLQNSIRTGFPGVNNGPIQVRSANSTLILSAMRVIWREPGPRFSYSELMGLPNELLSSEYWFPWYNNLATASMDQSFRFGNVDVSPTTIEVLVGNTVLGRYTLNPGQSTRQSFAVNNGPIRIRSTDGKKIIAAMRVIWKERGPRTSYTELMGLPKEHLSTEYWFPWYNGINSSRDDSFRIANVDTAAATIEVKIGGTVVENFTLGPGTSTRKSYAVGNGPVRIRSTNSKKIIAAMRMIWQEPGYRSSYTELMGLPKEQLSTEYWFPWYNDATPSMDQRFRIANINTSSTTVEVSVGPTILGTYSLSPGLSDRKRFQGVDNGPVHIYSTDGKKFIISLIVIWQEPGLRTSYSEMMGLPSRLLSTEYWFPWYNYASPGSMDQGLRIAAP